MHDPEDNIVRAEVHILGIEPAIRRTLDLPMNFNFAQLHEVLQASFGWTDSHIHQFDIGGLVYGAPEFDEDGLMDYRTFDATSVRLVDFDFNRDCEAPILVFYLYDFGDSWIHVIELTKQRREPNVAYPRCSAGTRSGPPEDVGGPVGYARFLKAWGDARDDEHKAMRDWVGRAFDPEHFDLNANNRAIARALRRSKGGYRFRLEA